MNTTIVFAHPWSGSFNKAILDRTVKKRVSMGDIVNVIDLNKDDFNPVMKEEDLALFSSGQFRDPLVGKYQKTLRNTSNLILIFPIWWFDVPAIMKGFIDKVMLKGFAYEETTTGLKGLLTHIRTTTIISTSEFPSWFIKCFRGNPIGGKLIKGVLRDIGLKNVKWYNNSYTSKEGDGNEKFLQSVIRKI